MHEALRQVLGEHVQQKGSLVDADKLRFDFSHSEAVSAEQLSQVADIVNAVLNTDVAALNKYKSERALYRKVAKLTSELEEIKAIVMSLSERLDNIENK